MAKADLTDSHERDWETPPGIGLGRLLREGEIAFSKLFRKELAAYGVTVAQYQHLRELWERDGISQGELSRRLKVESASSTATLDALERQGLIRRVRDTRDRRRVKVFLTRSGAGLRDALVDCARRTNVAATAGVSTEDVEAMFLTLNRVIANLRAAGGESEIAS